MSWRIFKEEKPEQTLKRTLKEKGKGTQKTLEDEKEKPWR